MKWAQSVFKKRNPVTNVCVSSTVQYKAEQLERLLTLNSAHQLWGKDQTLLRCNLLLVPTNRHYSVLLALGRKNRGKFTNGLGG